MSSLVDVIVKAIQEFLKQLFAPVTSFLTEQSNSLVSFIVRTRHPNAIFSQPTNGPWPEIYSYYWDKLVPLALFLWSLSIGLVIFLESTGYLFSSYHRSKLKRRAFSGLLGILAWWWMVAISLQFTDALTGFIVPDLSQVAFFDSLTFGGLGVLGLVLTLGTDLVLFALIAMIYVVREVVLFMFVLLMPLLIVFWIPGVGPFVLVSRFMKKLAGFYVPFLFMTVPVAILFRLSALLGSSVEPGLGSFGTWLAALVVPIIALVSPFILFWQAGGLFFMADRASHRVSYRRARNRVKDTAHRGRQLAGRVRENGFGGSESTSRAGGTGRRGGRTSIRGSTGRGNRASTDDTNSGSSPTDRLRRPDRSSLDSSHTDDPPPYLQ